MRSPLIFPKTNVSSRLKIQPSCNYSSLMLCASRRGREAIDMLQAMNTGHDGSLTTIHANTPRDALSRLETMIQMTGMRLGERAMRQRVAAAIDIVLQVARLSDGSRR